MAVSLTLRTARVDVVLPYCLVCGLDNSPSFTAGELNGTHNGAELPPALADTASWSLTPKGATVSELMLAVSSRGGASSNNFSMRALTFSPDLPLSPSMKVKAPSCFVILSLEQLGCNHQRPSLQEN